MNPGIYIAASGCTSRYRAQERIANNLANADTAGFKRDVHSFSSWLAHRMGSSPSTPGLAWTLLEGTKTDFSEGMIRETGNPMDFALEGEGFFVVETPEGIRYTRNGSFRMNSKGELVTQEGYRIQGEGGPIQVPENGLVADPKGILRSGGREIGRMRIVEFSDPSVLEKGGGSFFRPRREGETGREASRTTLHQGKLERSNVDVITEMVGMIEALRAFESYQRAIRALDEVAQKAANEVGRV